MTIEPALAAGKWVICDRFIDSTRVYQGALGKVDTKVIRSLERVTVGAAMPDLTFILDVPANIGLARAKARRGAARRRSLRASKRSNFTRTCDALFMVLAEREPKRMCRRRRTRAARAWWPSVSRPPSTNVSWPSRPRPRRRAAP